MAIQKILILNSLPEEIEILKKLCAHLGSVQVAASKEEAISLVEKNDFDLLVVDEAFADYSSLKGLFQTTTSIVITGSFGKKLKEIARSWPLNYYVDYHFAPLEDKNNESLIRALITASEYSYLKSEIHHLERERVGAEIKLRDAHSEIQKIKEFINNSVIKEMEKRISVEAKYVGIKKEKQRIETTLKKLYMANDVTSLLDIVYDIKEIVRAEGISIYILDENETLGKFLKPLVWDDAFLTHPEFSKHFVLLDSDDFAAYATRQAQVINISDISSDNRFSSRYAKDLKSPLKDLLCVPIMHGPEVIGALEVYNKTAQDQRSASGFTAEDQKAMARFCEHIAIAITKLNLIQYDALTGLLRPDAFFDKAIQKLQVSRKRFHEGSSFAMVMGDVDWFKNYNDRNGHEAGNKLLRELAGVLKKSTRDEDLLCRYGGEEFLFFLSGISNEDEAIGFTERIRKNIEAHHFENQEFQPNHNLTMSFGLTYFSRERIKQWEGIGKQNLKKLANEADMALAEAKGKRKSSPGRRDFLKNKVCIYTKEQFGESTPPSELEKQREQTERRRNRRHYTSTILVYKKKDFYRVTKTINLSLGGAKIPTDSLLNLNQAFDLILILGSNACQVKGEVVYSMMAGENYSHYFSGIKFLDLPAKDRQILEDYFSSLDVREEPLLH